MANDWHVVLPPARNWHCASVTMRKNNTVKCPFVPPCEIANERFGSDADPLVNQGDWEKRLAKVYNRRRSGIDELCHADGKKLLAGNQPAFAAN